MWTTGSGEWILDAATLLVTFVGFLVVVVQLRVDARERRLARLEALYAEFDTAPAREDRAFIYGASPATLRLDYLREHPAERRRVDNTLAMLERVAYPIARGERSAEQDAFNLYGGVLLAMTRLLWRYVEDEREMRKNNERAQKLLYRRYLEQVARRWARRYARALNQPSPSRALATKPLLDTLFEQPPGRGDRSREAQSSSR